MEFLYLHTVHRFPFLIFITLTACKLYTADGFIKRNGFRRNKFEPHMVTELVDCFGFFYGFCNENESNGKQTLNVDKVSVSLTL